MDGCSDSNERINFRANNVGKEIERVDWSSFKIL